MGLTDAELMHEIDNILYGEHEQPYSTGDALLLLVRRNQLALETDRVLHRNPEVLRRRQSVALVLAIMLGPLGVDRFYLGNPALGLLKLFTAGLFGFMWIIDIILIATKSVRGIDWI